MPCQHNHIVYTEQVPSETVWTFENGEITHDPINNSSRVEVVQVLCEDCKFYKTYHLATAPKWVKQLREKAIERGVACVYR